MKTNNNITPEFIETVERYINGSMSQQELNGLNQKLEADHELKMAFHDIKTLLLGIETQALKEELDQYHKTIPLSEKQLSTKNSRFTKLSKIAIASVIVLAIGSLWLFGKPTHEKLYAKYFKIDPGLPTTMGNTDNYEFYNAMVYYKHGDYDDALLKWKELSKNKPYNDTLNYFIGVTFMAKKNTEEAISYLEQTINSKNHFVLKSEAHYYLGLAYLKEGKIEQSKKHLDLSNSENGKALLFDLNK
ncbi:MAG: tetratricopeptide repeat protein [Flavobacteriaceae bacterium]